MPTIHGQDGRSRNHAAAGSADRTDAREDRLLGSLDTVAITRKIACQHRAVWLRRGQQAEDLVKAAYPVIPVFISQLSGISAAAPAPNPRGYSSPAAMSPGAAIIASATSPALPRIACSIWSATSSCSLR